MDGLTFRPYVSEAVLPAMAELIARDLSEPYSVYTYRFFLHEWPQLCETVAPAPAHTRSYHAARALAHPHKHTCRRPL
jgi:hypothetical protein